VGSTARIHGRAWRIMLQVSDSMKKFHIGAQGVGLRSLYAIAFSFMVALCSCRIQQNPEPVPTTDGTPPAVLRIGTSGDYAPFSLWPPGGSPDGFSISVAEAYADDSDIAIEWIAFRWPDLAALLEAGAFDVAISGITVRSDRSMLGRFGLPLTTSGAVVLVPGDSMIESASDLDHPSKRIAVNAGGHLERVARRFFPAARIESVPDNGSVLDRLVPTTGDPNAADKADTADPVDAVVTDSLEAPHWQQDWMHRREADPKREPSSPLRAIGPLTRDLKAAWFSSARESEARRFDEWLLAAESSGLLGELRRQYGLPDAETAAPMAALLASLDERLALMPAVAEAKAVLEIPIENEAREEVVLDAAVRSIDTAARAADIEAPETDQVRRLFRVQIEIAKWIQEETLRLRSHHASDASETSAPARDAERDRARVRLEEQIRPALLYLGDRIARLLVECLRSPSVSFDLEDVTRALQTRDLPEEQIRGLHDALRTLLRVDRRAARASDANEQPGKRTGRNRKQQT